MLFGAGEHTTIVGIDCGKDGAICVLRPATITFHDIPTLFTGIGGKRDYDVHEMAAIVRGIDELRTLHVFIEKQQPMPSKGEGPVRGSSGHFWSGFGYGIWLGLFGALGVAFTPVSPVRWKEKMLSDMPKGKEASMAKAKQLFPHAAENLKLKKHHNRAEALLLAEYGRQEHARLR